MNDAPTALLDAAELDSRYQPTRTRAVICMDSELVLEIARLEQLLLEIRQQDDSAAAPIGPLTEQIIGLQQRAKAAEVEFVFRSIGRRAYRDLIRAHPPTDEQRALVGENFVLQYNPDTFMPALLSAACESVRGATSAWWAEKCADWGDGQITRLWETCVAAQAGVNDTPKASHAYAAMRTRGASSD